RCVGNRCLSDPVNCDDHNPCTSDSCDPATGCQNTPIVDGVSCDDGNVCNGIATCAGGICTPGQALNCDDGNTCTTDGCNPQTGCTHQSVPGCCNLNEDCTDNNACTVNERCANHACTSDVLSCDNGNPCTIDSCNPVTGCVHTPVPNGQACGDNNFC